ncbi:HNH endonuclease family protein [Streptomyces syringium]|uniref:HNH endonuclease family protein n=1 Tax=Streptomyces syringium TaxID=76729 RepID=UPI0036AA6754
MLIKALRVLAAAAVAVLPLTVATPAQAETVGLHEAVASLPVAAESREGYQRTSFRHWVDADRDGCHTRAEVLIAEAVEAPEVGPGCKITGGRWRSWYDDTEVLGAGTIDIDHMVPLAEAWDSGASAWSAERRQAYANDLDADRSLAAVTARSNRSKADQDPATWMPPHEPSHCRYLEDWTATKLRWRLTVDEDEHVTLRELVASCPDTPLTYTPAP